MRNPYYLNRLFSEAAENNGYAISGPDGLLEQTPEQEYLVEQENLAELDPTLDEETLVHSYYPNYYGYQPQTYFYADDEDYVDPEDELTDEELQEATIKESLYQDWLAGQTRQFNAYATAQALQDLGVRFYSDDEELEGEPTDEELAQAEEEEIVDTIKQSLFDAWALNRMYSDDEDEEDLDDEDLEDEELDEATVIKESLYDDHMSRLYADTYLEPGEEIVHVDEFGNEVHPEVVKQALLDDYAYSRFYADADEETEYDADYIQDLHDGEDLDDSVDVPTANEELEGEAVKKQSSVYELEESVDALL